MTSDTAEGARREGEALALAVLRGERDAGGPLLDWLQDNPVTSSSGIRLEEAEKRALRWEGWPPTLLKASHDWWSYAAFVEGIGVIVFRRASRVAPGWVYLDTEYCEQDAGFRWGGDRGVDVRLEAIRWVKDRES